jgi:hypothetical protein
MNYWFPNFNLICWYKSQRLCLLLDNMEFSCTNSFQIKREVNSWFWKYNFLVEKWCFPYYSKNYVYSRKFLRYSQQNILEIHVKLGFHVKYLVQKNKIKNNNSEWVKDDPLNTTINSLVSSWQQSTYLLTSLDPMYYVSTKSLTSDILD